MSRRRVNTTKYEIIQIGTKLFLEHGYSATTPKMICDELDISTGNLTYYFPTKESLLEVLVEMLCKFQGQTLQCMVQEEGTTSLLAVCLEMALLATISESNDVTRDLFQAFYLSPLCLNVIRKNDTQRAKYIYSEYCSDWTEQQFIEAEILVSGIEYATLMATNDLLPLETRITGALNNMMMIFNVPEDVRKKTIEKILAMDYRTIEKHTLEQFKNFVAESNEQIFNALLNGKKADATEGEFPEEV